MEGGGQNINTKLCDARKFLFPTSRCFPPLGVKGKCTLVIKKGGAGKRFFAEEYVTPEYNPQ